MGLLSNLFARHRAEPEGPPIEIGPLTVVTDGGDWVVADEDYEAFYEHMDPDGYGPFEADPGDFWGGCTDCDGDFWNSEETGRIYCHDGYWYDRHFWNI